MKAYQAYATGGFRVTAESPAKAKEAFFAAFPTKRKCNIIEGDAADGFFTVTYGRKSEGQKPESFKDVTKNTTFSE